MRHVQKQLFTPEASDKLAAGDREARAALGRPPVWGQDRAGSSRQRAGGHCPHSLTGPAELSGKEGALGSVSDGFCRSEPPRSPMRSRADLTDVLVGFSTGVCG